MQIGKPLRTDRRRTSGTSGERSHGPSPFLIRPSRAKRPESEPEQVPAKP